jgi:hypothetical protein
MLHEECECAASPCAFKTGQMRISAVFKQWIVNREFRVPLSAMVAIETPRSFLGKSQLVKLLCVRYQETATRTLWRSA